MTDATASQSPDDTAASTAGTARRDAAETAENPPRCIPAVPLHERQLGPAMVTLQRAAAVLEWLKAKWPFQKIGHPGLDMTMEQWNALPELSE